MIVPTAIQLRGVSTCESVDLHGISFMQSANDDHGGQDKGVLKVELALLF
jgi:hypothetical protein